MIKNLLQQFNLTDTVTQYTIFGNGLINRTWVVDTVDNKYILQRINDNVFTKPAAIDENINAINLFLKCHFPEYIFTAPVFTSNHKSLIHIPGEGYFRLFEFIPDSHTYTVLENPALAFEASQQFGKFTKLLADFDSTQLNITLNGFHNLSLRYTQYTTALATSSAERLSIAQEAITIANTYVHIVETYETILANPLFKKRVTHHDTKISNVLFDSNNKGICVIDLDTVMPGYFISDVGDMMRTYLSPAGEEETDMSKIEIREPYFDAIVQGYLSQMNNELTTEEKKYFVYAGKFMIYMQALRFLTDYLNNNIYYGASYELHNLHRAINQLTLLQLLTQKEDALNKSVAVFAAQYQ
jgi:Ser/Thr protein kinase RdoA (MazF antagonist)